MIDWVESRLQYHKMGQVDDITPAAAQNYEKKDGNVALRTEQGESDNNSHDVEKQGMNTNPALQRRLKSRHLQMIAIGKYLFALI